MATRQTSSRPFSGAQDRGEATFFLIMACVMSATILAGFTLNIATGRSSFAAPLLVHLHAAVMLGWIGLYLAQNSLIFLNHVALHRQLGWLSVLMIPAVVTMGLLITRYSIQSHGGPPFFDVNQFLISNPLHLLGFAGLASAAIVVRRNTGWHRRLLFCAFAMLTGPGVGRLVPAPLLIPYVWYLTAVLPALLFMGTGALADKRRYGAVHPAWLVGIGTVIAIQIVADLFAYSALGEQFTLWFIEGTAGAQRPLEAFFPPL
ncbi:MAG: hypothetical protein JY451_08125 [Erythrobacter sp.]|nr:MAG: hypothetical protein JY451_08125 [Erythrobacter sp.]